MLDDARILGSIYMGTLVGAGFASGREIMNFFTVYGIYGFYGIIFACVLFFLIGCFILRTAIRYQTATFKDIMKPVYGSRLTAVFELISNIYLVSSFFIMLSGCGAVLCEGLQIPYPLTVFCLCILCIFWLKQGVKGLARVNTFLVPLMLILTIAIGFSISLSVEDILVSDVPIIGEGHWLLSSIIYVSFNMTSGIVVLFSLGRYTKWEGASFFASLIASFGMLVMGVLIWAITVVNFFDVAKKQIPLLCIAKKQGRFYFWSSILVLISAMLTTALSSGYAFVRGIQERFNINYNLGIFILLMGIPLTFYGFSHLIKTVYPIFGIVGMCFVLLIFVKKVFEF